MSIRTRPYQGRQRWRRRRRIPPGLYHHWQHKNDWSYVMARPHPRVVEPIRWAVAINKLVSAGKIQEAERLTQLWYARNKEGTNV